MPRRKRVELSEPEISTEVKVVEPVGAEPKVVVEEKIVYAPEPGVKSKAELLKVIEELSLTAEPLKAQAPIGTKTDYEWYQAKIQALKWVVGEAPEP